MIYYHNSILDGDLTLSVDNIVIDTSITRPEIRDLFHINLDQMARRNKVNIRTWTSNKPGTFHDQTTIRVDDNRSFWVGHGLVGSGTLVDRYRLDANPNKVGDDPNFKLIREFLVRNSRDGFCKVSRFDLAVDIPVDRSRCFLVKDRRMYIERRHGEEFTQYLGSKSSTVGRVKLYNKTAEAKLNYPLTRLELTLNPITPYEEINLPKVYVVDDAAMALAAEKLTDTDRFILNAVVQGCGQVTDLCRKMGEKIKCVLNDYISEIEITRDSYEKILNQINSYCTVSAQ